ncbi:MAG TPA: bifunctional lysylphosphatidylglycerol flippase/synthetase MprF [Epulopiscium sp.]|nr:bifunctional lysylphosphatidylglycerol flippase/synthetase MprF [Candidatus Epulonipiscium sp.]
MNKKNRLKITKIIILGIILILIFYGGHRQIKLIDFAKTIILIRSFEKTTIFTFFLLGIVGTSLMTLYDFIIIDHMKLGTKKMTVFNVSFIANTINNVSGLGGLTGASIRAVFFKKDTNSQGDIEKYGLLLLPATGVGLSLMSIITLIKYKYVAPIIQENKWLLAVLLGFIAYLIIYFYIDRIYCWLKHSAYKENKIEMFYLKMKLLGVSFLEWFIASVFFIYIVRQFNTDISVYGLLGVFTLASVAGVISLLPGGIGSFDLIILLGLQYYGATAEHVLATLILYRVFYYFMPLVTGLILTLLIQLQKEKGPLCPKNINKIKEIINNTSNITNLFIRILVLLSGVVLLVSALVPGIESRIKIAAKLLSFPILQLSHQLSISIGILLIIISREIGMKVKRAYHLTFYLLLSGAFFTFLKGFDYEEAIFIGIVLLLLKMSKKSYSRKSLPFNWMRTTLNVIVAFIGVGIYVNLKHLIIDDFLHRYTFAIILKQGTFNERFSGIIAYASLIIFLVVWQKRKPKIANDKRYEELDEEKLGSFLNDYNGHYLTHLIYLKDKHIFWAVGGKVAIVYEKSHNIIVILGDPIGEAESFGEAISEFQEFIDEYGYKSAFYQVSESLLSIYHDHGYNFFKLGETALVDLEAFDLTGAKKKDFRNILSRFKRDGYVFELFTTLPDELFGPLKEVSDEWLQGRNEMGFSLGRFDEGYLKHSPIGIIKEVATGEIIAFASVMPSYNKNQSASIDLMRFKKETPNSTMTFLILNLLISYKENGYKVFNLGMAPLSNVGKAQSAHSSEKIAHLVTHYGNHFYSFDGLRNYKEKFDPKWGARYLAYEDMVLLPSSLIEATILIHAK